MENDQSSAESMEIMIRLNVGYKSVENAERVEHNIAAFIGSRKAWKEWKMWNAILGNFTNST